MRWYDERFWYMWLTFVATLMVVAMMTSCKTKYISVPEYHKEYIVKNDSIYRVDSIMLHDSVATYIKGDTVYVNNTRYRDRIRIEYKDRNNYINKVDSVQVVKTVEVEKPYTIWQRAVIGLCSCLLMISLFIGLKILVKRV